MFLRSCDIRRGAAVVLVDPLWWIVWLALCCLHCLHCHRWLARANYGLPCIIAAPQWVEAPRGGTGITSRWTKWTTPLKQPDKPTALAFMRRCFAWKGLRTKCWFKNVKVGRFIHRRSSSPVYDKANSHTQYGTYCRTAWQCHSIQSILEDDSQSSSANMHVCQNQLSSPSIDSVQQWFCLWW